jgi:hypothetical protein
MKKTYTSQLGNDWDREEVDKHKNYFKALKHKTTKKNRSRSGPTAGGRPLLW